MKCQDQTGAVIAIALIVATGITGLAAGYFWLFLTWNFSVGERAGWVQKLSKKGWVCKTWEGELSLVSMPGTTPEKFLFTVHDDDVAAAINKLIGQRVSLHYEEKVGLPTSCFGDTRHFITKVVALEQTPSPPGAAKAVAN